MTIQQTPQKVLLLGSGGLKIGQAGEFDYSGSQAIKALKESNIEVILVNPNIATVQTDEHMADRVYLQPLSCEVVTHIIEQEKPDAIMLSFGGQTALNLGLELDEKGILAKHNVRVLGSSVDTIRKAEDRAIFKETCQEIGVKTAKSFAVETVDAALTAAEEIGFPLMLRSGFSLGGLGSGIIPDKKALKIRAEEALAAAPQILIEENLIGWGEFEYEIVRDQDGNTITVCNMENFDPMGIHTGESIVVSPSQTLNNNAYHLLREIAIKVANHFNVIGECNIQYAFNQQTQDYRVIEINPRLSRSSALASKATGYPLAFIAAKLALGHPLYELQNSITRKTCAFFEPALDYLVVKMPRWDIHKLKGADRHIGTEMKSVGEVMAIGRSFPEALQKAVGMLNNGASCLADYPFHIENIEHEIAQATDRRLFALYQFFKKGGSPENAQEKSHINPWFLNQLAAVAQFEKHLSEPITPDIMKQAKRFGFTDKVIAQAQETAVTTIRDYRKNHNITPVVKQIDTLAGECEAQTNYLYLTYHGQYHDVEPSHMPAHVIIGSGPYSIGSSVEFDWCAVTTARTLRHLGHSPIMINANPETVSTDYDESDRLYFEQLSNERVQDILDYENLAGVIVSVGGQIANNLVMPLHQAGFPILGTSPDNIDQAEDRAKFSALLNELGVDQPAWIAAERLSVAKTFAKTMGYPVLIRPSFVLSGAAMNVVYSESQMEKYLKDAATVSPNHPVVVTQFIEGAKELELDGVALNGEIIIDAISEHIENAGVHSGDATIVLPPQRLYLETIRRTKKITRQIVKALNITGPFNIQFIAKNNEIKVIECNLRASRSFPFVSKVTHHNFIDIATRLLVDAHQPEAYETLELDYVGVKTPQFSYNRLKGANPVAHVEMASTGEVACLGEDLQDAFYRSWLATGQAIETKAILLSLWGDFRPKLLDVLRTLDQLGWDFYTTPGTHDFLARNGIGSRCVYKPSDAREPSAISLMSGQKIGGIINLSHPGHTGNKKTDGFTMRRAAIDHHIPLITNFQIADLFLQCLANFHGKPIQAKAWQDFVAQQPQHRRDTLAVQTECVKENR